MRLTAVNSNPNRQYSNNYNNRKNNSQNTNFTGMSDFLVKAWQIIDSNRGIQFTVEDMLGTNIPRTCSGAMSGYEYTGKINWPYLLQEGIREFLTGPTMTLAPIGILALITKYSGKTANTHKNNIINLSYLANTLEKGKLEKLEKEAFKTEFIKKVTEDMIEKSTNTSFVEEDVKQISELIKKCSAADKKESKEILTQIGEKFEQIIKSRKENFKNTDFKTAIHSVDENKTGSTNIKNYVKFINAYLEDYTKSNTKDGFVDISEDAIKNFKTSWCGKRVLTVASMIFGTGILMSFIPKIYTLASGGINPGGAAIYNEAAKREGK